MRSKQAKVFSLILATAISSTFTAVPYQAKAMTDKNGIIYVTKKDVKNGEVVISNKTAKSIIIKRNVKKATIRLKRVKLSNGLIVEKGNYVLKTSKSTVKSLKISEKGTNLKLDKSADLNKRNFVLKVAKNAAGTLDISEFGKKITAELGKNSDVNIKVGNNDKASVIVKKASVTSKLGITEAGEGASISKIRVESPVKLTVKVNTAILETAKKADKAVINIENKVAEVKNEAGSAILDNEAKRRQEEKVREEKEKAEREKADKEREERAKEEKAKQQSSGSSGSGSSGGGSYTPSVPEKKATAITLVKEGGELDTDNKKIKIKVNYTPADATNKNIEWSIKEGADKVKILSSNAMEAEIQALDNGNYKIEAIVKGSTVKAEIDGAVSAQKVGLAEGSVGMAADKKITGLTPSGIYVLQESEDYYSVVADGTTSGKYTTLNEASLYSKKLTGTELKALYNAKTYKVHEIAKEGLFEKQIDTYLKYTADSINKDNYSDIKEIGNKLVQDIDAKIAENMDPAKAAEKAKWEDKKTKVTTKKAVLEAAIDVIEGNATATKAAITTEYNKINMGKPAAEIAKAAVGIIEERRKELSEKDFKSAIADMDIYNAIKADVNKLNLLIKTNLLVGSNGEATFGQAQNVEFKYKIIHTHTSMGAVVPNTTKVEGTVEPNKQSFSVLKELRKAGLGWYKISVYKEFTKIGDFTVAETYAPVKVELLEKMWGKADNKPPISLYDGTTFTHKAGTHDTIRLVKKAGKWVLEWDEVDNATSYDVMAGFNLSVQEGVLGSCNLTSTEDNYANVENEFDTEPLKSLGNEVYQNEKTGDKLRTMVAVGLTSRTMELDKLMPIKGGGVGENFWKENKDDIIVVDIWIIPRNRNGLYVSNMKEYLSPQMKEEFKRNKFYIEGEPQNKFTVKDFYEKFYGKPFPY